ncbi:MAG: hypothetical protein IK115_02450 [Lachnospiraceae bacterium]|nr:hypothetical protein [Lachnospiraceae bacterium]
MKKEKPSGIVYGILFPVLLLLYAAVGSAQGAELSDTLYSVGNYAFFHESSNSWHYATFLANLLGRVFFLLGGGKLIPIRILSSLVPGCTALLVWFALKDKLHPLLLFAAELLALGLCWSPSVILYQHLSYLVLTAASLLLYKAMRKTEAERKGQDKLLLLAGLILGLGLYVRISNLTYCALILFVLIPDITRKEMKLFPKHLLLCVGGFFAGVAAGLLLILIFGSADGLKTMAEWIGGLLSGSGGEGYTMGELLLLIADNYLGNLKYALAAFAGIFLSIILFSIKKDKFVMAKRIVICGGITLLLFWYYRNGVWDTKYYNYGSIFRISVVLLWLLAALYIRIFFDKKASPEEKALALLALLVQLITPLGSNNHLYSCINNLYFCLPVGVLLAKDHIGRAEKHKHFPAAAVGSALLLLLLVQSVGFHICFAFKDGTDGTKRDVSLLAPERMKGCFTGYAHARALEGLSPVMEGREGKLLTYGNLPGLNYAYNMPPALSTLWPDLDSYPAADFEKELKALEESGERPLCVLSREVAVSMAEDTGKKLPSLKEFLYNNDYAQTYANEEFVVMESVIDYID